jgi:hypothetical protein
LKSNPTQKSQTLSENNNKSICFPTRSDGDNQIKDFNLIENELNQLASSSSCLLGDFKFPTIDVDIANQKTDFENLTFDKTPQEINREDQIVIEMLLKKVAPFKTCRLSEPVYLILSKYDKLLSRMRDDEESGDPVTTRRIDAFYLFYRYTSHNFPFCEKAISTLKTCLGFNHPDACIHFLSSSLFDFSWFGLNPNRFESQAKTVLSVFKDEKAECSTALYLSGLAEPFKTDCVKFAKAKELQNPYLLYKLVHSLLLLSLKSFPCDLFASETILLSVRNNPNWISFLASHSLDQCAELLSLCISSPLISFDASPVKIAATFRSSILYLIGIGGVSQDNEKVSHFFLFISFGEKTNEFM